MTNCPRCQNVKLIRGMDPTPLFCVKCGLEYYPPIESLEPKQTKQKEKK